MNEEGKPGPGSKKVGQSKIENQPSAKPNEAARRRGWAETIIKSTPHRKNT